MHALAGGGLGSTSSFRTADYCECGTERITLVVQPDVERNNWIVNTEGSHRIQYNADIDPLATHHPAAGKRKVKARNLRRVHAGQGYQEETDKYKQHQQAQSGVLSNHRELQNYELSQWSVGTGKL